jgi:subtilisin family serine protease
MVFAGAAAAAALAVLASPPRSEQAPLGPLLPPLCIVPPLLVSCPETPPPGPAPPPEPVTAEPAPPVEPPPVVVTPTQVRYDEHRILVRLRKGTAPRAAAAAFKRAGVTVERRLRKIGFYLVRAPEGQREKALTSLRGERAVKQAEREVLVDALDTQPHDPSWADQWGLQRARFPRAWDATRGSSRIVVAVLDTGVTASHPDLKGAVGPGFAFVNLDSDPSDDGGHGTAVAGIIAARGDNGIGLAGACWTCTIMPVKVLDAEGRGDTTRVAAGIIWAADHGADVINLSLGAPGTTDALSAAVRYAIAKNVVVVAAAGNSGSAIPFHPAAEASVLGVAATNEQDRLYTWSNRGPWVEVAAPGCNVAPWTGGAYISLCGTSAAAPLVSGLAALVVAAQPRPSVSVAIEALQKAVVPISADVRNGRIDAGLALARVGLEARPPQAATRKVRAYEGHLDGRARSRVYTQVVGRGRVAARLTFRRGQRLSLWLSMAGRPITRASGASVLRVVATVPPGTIRLLVAGRPARASYRLAVSYVAP